MKKTTTIFALLCTMAFSAQAAPVTPSKAQQAARQYIVANNPSYAQSTLTLCDTWNDSHGDATMYVFNIGSDGFIIISANDDMPPIQGVSFNGAYRRDSLPPNLHWWLEACNEDIEAVLSCSQMPRKMAEEQQQWRAEWTALETKDLSYYQQYASKAVQALVQTKWDQCDGYNNYCPQYSGAGYGYGGRSATGCVATAMAQIIRYYEYPNTGFYHHSYSHRTYGRQSADFDSTYYDFTLMPNSIYYNTPSSQKNAVSLLCYHCGVAVNMNYQNPDHPDGSGASSEEVPDALKYFGYTNSFILYKNPNNDIWDSLLRHDLNLGRPVYYSGKNGNGGHAFICDGYTNNNLYHFNFGWGGHGDGNYSLTSVNGYSTAQDAIFNIYPSHIGANIDTLYIDSEGSGDGSSWQSGNPNLESAIILRGLYHNGTILVKHGTYYGDVNAASAFTMQKGLKIYGGFDGSEQDIDQRDASRNKSILSGNGKRQVINALPLSPKSEIYSVVLSNGLAADGSAIEMNSGLSLEDCTIANCSTTAGGNAALVNGGNIFCSTFENNNCRAARLSGGYIKNSLIVHNNGGVAIESGNLINCDIVSNSGLGVDIQGGKMRNCIVWNNDSSTSQNESVHITFCAIEGYGERDTNSNFGLLSENRPTTGIGPFFIEPDLTRGPSSNTGDWHLSSLSPLLDIGDTVKTGVYTKDRDGNNRFRNGRIDLGCYERDPSVSIPVIPDNSTVSILPNPASTTLNIVSAAGTVQIFDMMGRLVLSAQTTGHQTTLDVSHLPNGVYLFTLNGTATKFIKR